MAERVRIRRNHPWQNPENPAIIVDRRTIFGNPFKVGKRRPLHGTNDRRAVTPQNADEAVALYREWLMGDIEIPGTLRPGLTEITAGLQGADLACWCAPDQPCHADVLLELANPTTETPR